MSANKRILSLDGLKGISAIMVFVGHYASVWQFAQEMQPLNFVLNIAIQGYAPIGKFFNESFWLYIFLVISGFLLANKKINNVKDILIEMLRRFFRLFIPILFSLILIVVLQNTFGFYNSKMSEYFISPFIQNSYTDTLKFTNVFIDTFRVILFGYFDYNEPFWMISSLFYSSTLIYAANFLVNKNKRYLLLISVMMILLAGLLFELVGVSCALGFYIYHINDYIDSSKIPNKKLKRLLIANGFVFLFIFSGLYNAVWYNSMKVIPLPNFTYEIENAIGAVGAASLVFLVIHIDALKKVFESKIAINLYKINWGVYAFHWPIMCSFTCYFVICFNEMNPTQLFILCLALTTIIVLIVAWIYYHTIEKVSNSILLLLNKKYIGNMKIRKEKQ